MKRRDLWRVGPPRRTTRLVLAASDTSRSADSTTYALPGGELQTEAYAGPVRVKQDGAWKNIDTSLSDTGADLTPAVATADIAVSDGGDTQYERYPCRLLR